MEKWVNLFRNQKKTYSQLASDNCSVIRAYNEKMLSLLSLMGGVLMLLPLLATPFSKTKSTAIIPYLLSDTFFFCAVLFISTFNDEKVHTDRILCCFFRILSLGDISQCNSHT